MSSPILLAWQAVKLQHRLSDRLERVQSWDWNDIPPRRYRAPVLPGLLTDEHLRLIRVGLKATIRSQRRRAALAGEKT
jgi:hypothetical protein